MGNHYYTNQPEVAHDRKKWTFPLRGKNFTFITDSNVFSKGTVDFGSRVLIDAFDDTNLPEGDILDVGCGYGPIGLSLAHSTGRHVEMVDVNERAVELAKENADLNGIKHVTIYPSNIYEKVERTDFAAVVSNPPIRAGKSVVHGIIEESYDKLVKSGTLTIVIQKKQGAPSAKKKMEEIFGNAEVVAKEKGYFIIVSEK
ncbi:class I SAM-dependent methyltransferase [Vagococcus carniphilus]|uniref:class I SAM-dependent methyltransferase n=1 Tax=Vagococcus carniphilus TaxID=218144 RepID=UPI0028908A1C|nr:class I SAM-dependent methyltransferase [Vagococcus carniphilus]HBM6538969.1 class I SAM-dependent methyltransferase [Enterococcus faecium]MDT2816163.1 class I SAM-dependent methyltransferase [Vagococcus carniphilus]MDT2831157.1 class I SAM-dependent methyltransferase [Vagococcus carniphilus]MDT2839684.1 class I SAM-dependent methyltransferase [Vagococcus carniphilus]MDT2849124.1 class I SAM-dependent methyltransferase [Vagococcus carniphilus]